MKPEILEDGIIAPSGYFSPKEETQRSLPVRRDELQSVAVGFRLCPCKIGNAHYHNQSGPFCDVPNNLFDCLPRGMSCSNEGLCCFKTEIPGLFGRVVSSDEARFALSRMQLIRGMSHAMGRLHGALNKKYGNARFPRRVIVT